MLRTELTHFLPRAAHQLRREVFIDEQGFAEEFDQTDRTAWHLTLYEGSKALACCRIFPDGPVGVWHIGRVAVRRGCRGRGLGAAVMARAEQAAASLGADRLVLSAQQQAEGFYRKLGYIQVGAAYLEEHCPHVRMEKRLNAPRAADRQINAKD